MREKLSYIEKKRELAILAKKQFDIEVEKSVCFFIRMSKVETSSETVI